jgi:Na+/melibiose symporter-like transporter
MRSWKIGFRRLWLVLSIIWSVFAVGFSLQQSQAMAFFFWAGIVPVIAMYFLLMSISWVIEGFAKTDR